MVLTVKRLKTGGRQPGTPNKATADVKLLAQKYGPEAIEQLWALALGAESESARVAAIKEMLDRAYGKATQLIGGDESAGPLTFNVVYEARKGIDYKNADN